MGLFILVHWLLSIMHHITCLDYFDFDIKILQFLLILCLTFFILNSVNAILSPLLFYMNFRITIFTYTHVYMQAHTCIHNHTRPFWNFENICIEFIDLLGRGGEMMLNLLFHEYYICLHLFRSSFMSFNKVLYIQYCFIPKTRGKELWKTADL